jgi:RNA polymerase Rpb1, domain 1
VERVCLNVPVISGTSNSPDPSFTSVPRRPKVLLTAGFLDKVKKILESVCVSCGKLKVDESNPKFVEALRYRDPKSRLTAVWNVAKTKLVCEATLPQEDDPNVKDGMMAVPSHGGCGNAQPIIRKEGLKLFGSWRKASKDFDVSHVLLAVLTAGRCIREETYHSRRGSYCIQTHSERRFRENGSE